jgi:hypothetical protein
MDYYFLRGKPSKNPAVVEVPCEFDEFQFCDDLEAGSDMSSWTPLKATTTPWRKGHPPGELVDLPPTNLLPRLCSQHLKSVLSGFSGDFLWVPVQVKHEANTNDFYIIHFRKYPVVINREKSKFIETN